MKGIHNSGELSKLNSVIEEVLESVSKRVLDALKQHIYKDTYKFEYWPNRMYHSRGAGDGYPTFQFLDAWKLSEMKRTVSGAVKELFYDYSGMDFEAESWLHGSRWGDARENLAEILNVAGYTSSLMVSSVVGHYVPNDRPFSKFRAPYYDLFITDMFAKGELQSIFVEEFAEMGFIIQKK